MSRAFYFGVRPGDDGGHHFYPPSFEPSWIDPRSRKAQEHGCPFGGEVDGKYAPQKSRIGYRVAHHSVPMGGKIWTVLAWHDYTGDDRPGSNSAIFIDGQHDYDAAMAIARRMFPGVFNRLHARRCELVPAC